MAASLVMVAAKAGMQVDKMVDYQDFLIAAKLVYLMAALTDGWDETRSDGSEDGRRVGIEEG